MSDLKLEVYLYFRGNCKEAMEFYKSVFGGELQFNTYGESPGTDPDKKDWIMHAHLTGGPVKLMASDTEEASERSAKVELTLGGTDEAELRKIFDSLAEGGGVTTPLEKQFWGDIYGKLTDRFGVDWSMNIGQPAK
jgi:PhnB protein